MQYLYIDESGSMTNKYSNDWPYFVIAIVRTDNSQRLRRLHKRFVKSNLGKLKAIDTDGKMFKNGVFHELKGSAFTSDLKRAFAGYFGQQGTLDLFYIVIQNKGISDSLYANTARAFNYILKLALEYFIKHGYLPDDEYVIQLDERNERTDTRHFLQNYLNTELRMENVLSHDVHVQYFDSALNRNIQIADVFANLYYSHLLTDAYSQEMKAMQDHECLKPIFRFPLYTA